MYWTGFYTTDPTFKKDVADFSHFGHAVSQQLAFEAFKWGVSEQLLDQQNSLEEWISVVQHHDGITGTHYKSVGKDYRSTMETR